MIDIGLINFLPSRKPLVAGSWMNSLRCPLPRSFSYHRKVSAKLELAEKKLWQIGLAGNLNFK